MSDTSVFGFGIASLVLLAGVLGWTLLSFRRLKTSEIRYRTATKRAHLAQSIAGLGYVEWYYDSDETIVSQHVRELLRLHPTARLTTSDLTARLHPDDAQRVTEALEATRTGESYDIEHRFDIPGTGVVWVHAFGTPLHDSRKNVVGLLGVFLDITDRKQMEERHARMQIELGRARRYELIETLAGRIVHDFNNVLQGILGNLDLEIEVLGGNENASADLLAAREATLTAIDLVSNLKLLNRDNSAPAEPVYLGEIVRTSLSRQPRCELDGIQLTLELDEECGPVSADRSALITVFEHIIDNAVQALDRMDGNISVDLKELKIDSELNRLYPEIASDRCAIITVTDSGCGIHEKDLSKVFDPLFSTKSRGTGVGLGLAIVRSVIDGLGGCVRVQSGDGTTTITVVLPIAHVVD